MTKLTLQFCSFHSFGGRLIAWFTQGTVGHVDIVLPDGSLLGAQFKNGLGGKPSGVQIRPADYGDNCHMFDRFRVSFEVPDADADRAYKWLYQQVDKPYDTLGIAAFIFGRDWRDEGAWFCDELATVFLEKARVFRHICMPANRITPAGLFLMCSVLVPVVAYGRHK